MKMSDKVYLLVLVMFLVAAMWAVSERIVQNGRISVSAFDIVERLSNAETDLKLVSASHSDSLKKLKLYEDGMTRLWQNHNGLAKVMSEAGQTQQNNLLLMNAALIRIHGKPDWEAALAGARAELENAARTQQDKALKALENAATNAVPQGPMEGPCETE